MKQILLPVTASGPSCYQSPADVNSYWARLNKWQQMSFKLIVLFSLEKRRISAKCSCQANNADATPSDWQMTCAHLSLCVLQLLFAFSFQEVVRTNTACLLTDTWWSALETELLTIEFLSETSPTCLLLLIWISLYWTSSCVPAGPAKHTKLKLDLNW